MSIITLDYLKTQLGITGTSEDALLTQLLDQVTSIIENETHRKFSGVTTTEYYDGDGTDRLVLRNTPVQSITSIYEDVDGYAGAGDSPFGADTLLTAGEDYVLDTQDGTASNSGIVYRINGVWRRSASHRQDSVGPHVVPYASPSRGSIKVTYTYGYSTVPDEIKLAAANLVGSLRRSAKLGKPINSFSLDYFSVQLEGSSASEASAALESTNRILARYRKPVF